MRAVLFFTSIAMLTSACSTIDQSFRLGAATGALAGAAATYAAGRASGGEPTFEDVGIGASIGLGIGLVTSYFVHQSVVEDRESSARQCSGFLRTHFESESAAAKSSVATLESTFDST